MLVSALPVFLVGLWARSTAVRLAGAAGVAIAAAVIALAHSRIGLALGLAVAAGAAYVWTRSRAVIAGGIALALAAGALAFGSGDGPESGFLHGREETWRAAIETFLDRPVTGAGADAFLAGSARHQDGAAVVFAHDLPLELAAELGILGLLLALALYAGVGTVAWTRRATRAGLLFGTAALAFPLANLLDWPWHLAGSGAIWAIACGALAGARGLDPEAPGAMSPPTPNQGDP
jgi:O-antigen ligase